ncbi:hypothetical protein GCM10008927_02430 [Amylibacter ulvae]|uniref:Uncharacterized protein n=1 Tax=Paramylibacter ulvae TaxID=1651968 RepID=A0ABQ3CS68_9RHOB|nr:hypothetical protein [Amylibacter ulvae]GHA41570.1 hypothetical protein GCM10008927_02430 [Amylibacter ulvae]
MVPQFSAFIGLATNFGKANLLSHLDVLNETQLNDAHNTIYRDVLNGSDGFWGNATNIQ